MAKLVDWTMRHGMFRGLIRCGSVLRHEGYPRQRASMTVEKRTNGREQKRALPLAQRTTMLKTGSGGRHVVLDFHDLLMEASLLRVHVEVYELLSQIPEAVGSTQCEASADDATPQSAPASSADAAVPGGGIAAGSFSCLKERRGSPMGGDAYTGSMESPMRLPQGS
jgi:hypothetical protein